MPLLEDMLRDARARAAAVLDLLPHPEARLHKATSEHERLLDAILAHDPGAAAEAASAHIDGSARHIVDLLSGDGTELFRSSAAHLGSGVAEASATPGEMS